MAPFPATLQQATERLEQIEAAVARLGAGLFELDTERDNRAAELTDLRGTSFEAWARSASQLSVLWTWYRSLAAGVDRVRRQWDSSKRRPADVSQLWDELTSPTIELPGDSLALAATCLPEDGPVPNPASFGVLVKVLSYAFARLAETLTSIYTVRDLVLTRLHEVEQDLVEYERQGQSAGIRLGDSNADVRTDLERLRELARQDPLAVEAEEVPRLAARVGAVAAQISEALASVAGVEDALARVDSRLAAAGETLAEVEASVQLATERISGLPISDEFDLLQSRFDHLRQLLGSARSNLATDRQAVSDAVSTIEAGVANLLSDAAALASAADAALARRKELRGRLDGYRAKAQAIGRGEDPGLNRLFRAAKDSLYSAPCDLRQAELRVDDYQAAVRGTSLEDRSS
jgi:hypothetical protein